MEIMPFRIHHFTPFSRDKNFGKELNYYASLVKDENDWLCLRDMDTMFLTPNAPNIIIENILAKPETGMFVCVSNRAGSHAQRYNDIISDDKNILNHYDISQNLSIKKRLATKKTDANISGYLMCIKKKTWDAIGGAKEDGILGIDRDLSKKIYDSGREILIMEGVYLFHFYRFNKHRKDITHLT